MFKRYTIIVQIGSRTTSVYCTECEEWVAEWPGEQLSQNTESELYEKILSSHEDDFSIPVEISDSSINIADGN